MSLVTVAEVRVLVNTSLTDQQLQAAIDREEAIMVERCGAHYVNTNTRNEETLRGGYAQVFLKQKVTSIFRVTEDGTVLSQTDGDFRLWPLEGCLERLPAGAAWGTVVAVLYVPYDDNERRKAVLIEMVRTALERTALASESVAGEYSYHAPDFEYERARLLRSINFRAI
jgi:uncharacterized protein (UPF0264 family)